MWPSGFCYTRAGKQVRYPHTNGVSQEGFRLIFVFNTVTSQLHNIIMFLSVDEVPRCTAEKRPCLAR